MSSEVQHRMLGFSIWHSVSSKWLTFRALPEDLYHWMDRTMRVVHPSTDMHNFHALEIIETKTHMPSLAEMLHVCAAVIPGTRLPSALLLTSDALNRAGKN
jgi:hypothetical protein